MPSKLGTVPTYSTLSGYIVPAASCASAVKELPGSPDRKSRFVQNRVMRVRGSAGLKFASEVNEKGSASIDTDSRATALVEPDETVNSDGVIAGAADDGDAAPPAKTAKLAQQSETKHLRKAKARIFIQ